ncbi:hypothetical protein [Ruegeria sp. Ofav3-42]|uniref:hypothetical protein n=1 Tax=Ruegeria sp. Ofav3-42 TaxID=2917759 RepID=UPI001EF3F657|nr:hypothetical protein [Ruegeria sp. Ofav3-42]MCG7518447.1 hypothetical protein [Ruegeria sp. Ofav3-42]
MNELENALREANEPLEKLFVKVGANYYCHLTGETISAAAYCSLRQRLTLSLSAEEQIRLRRRNKLHAIAAAADASAGAR